MNIQSIAIKSQPGIHAAARHESTLSCQAGMNTNPHFPPSWEKLSHKLVLVKSISRGPKGSIDPQLVLELGR